MAFDIRLPASYPIRLGAGISKSNNAESKHYAALKYNYRIRSRANAKFALRGNLETKRDSTGRKFEQLQVDAEQGSYSFAGHQSNDEETYILIIHGNTGDGDKDRIHECEAILEKVEREYTFNITSTPEESNAKTLNEQYPPLSSQDTDADMDNEEDLFGSDDDAPPSAENPFDFRHFLKAELESSSQETSNADALRSSAATPLVHTGSSTITSNSTPLAKPTTITKRTEPKPTPSNTDAKKRKTPTARANGKGTRGGRSSTAKRVKAGVDELPSPSSPPHSSPHTDIPTMRLERKASIRHPAQDPEPSNNLTFDFDYSNENDLDNSTFDSGELILENDPSTSTSTSHPRSGGNAMSLALAGNFGSGPISLRSAASSPATSTHQLGAGDEEGDYDQDDGDNDDDDDVENLRLPPPRSSVSVPQPPQEEDDDLDRQLLLAMEEEAESEESEEE